MNRLGFSTRYVRASVARDSLGNHAAVGELRLMTHLSSADDVDSPVTREQLDAIPPDLTGRIRRCGELSPIRRPCSVGRASHWTKYSGLPGRSSGSGPACRCSAFRRFPTGPVSTSAWNRSMQFRSAAHRGQAIGGRRSRVGYKGAIRCRLGLRRWAYIAAGYGDGYTRHFRDGTPVLLNGRRVPLIGNVSMDMIAVDLGPKTPMTGSATSRRFGAKDCLSKR